MVVNVGVVGTGATPDNPDRRGFGMAYKHGAAYRRLEDCRLVACADVVPEHAEQFADHFELDAVFDEAAAMVTRRDLDVVSVCVPPGVHAEVVTTCAREGDLAAIHCEKPMATTWQESREMASVCAAQDVELTVNHQRRLGPTYRKAKDLLDAGRIGELRRIEIATGNLFDAGTHLFDLCGLYTDQTEADWVVAQIDYREENRWFGAHNENQALAQWRYEDGVFGLASMGVGEAAVDCYLRLIGDRGTIEIGPSDGPPLRYRSSRTLGWKTVDTGENIWGDRKLSTVGAGIQKLAPHIPGVTDDPFERPSHIDLAIESVVEAVRTGGRSELRAEHALQASELIFASWESARKRGRVELPLRIDDNPLESMVEAGQLPVGSATEAGSEAGSEGGSEGGSQGGSEGRSEDPVRASTDGGE